MKGMMVGVTIPFLAMAAAAQEAPARAKVVTAPTMVMANVVKGAPYSADEITESSQVLADGTHIQTQSKVTVYRDGDGRVRRDNGKEVTIWDPVAGVSYTLLPQSMTAVKSPMGWTTYNNVTHSGTATQSFYFTTSSGATVHTAEAQPAADPRTVAATLDKLKAELDAQQSAMVVNDTPADTQTIAAMKEQLAVAMKKAAAMDAGPLTPAQLDKIKAATIKSAVVKADGTKTESLGQQVMQGLAVDGARTTTVIETGAIGNDRPINVVTERWYSGELQTVAMTKHTDPRSGEESFHLDNVRRGEPGMDLFQVPAGYTVRESPTAKILPQTKKEE